MLSEERRDLILERLGRDGKVVAADLSAELAVSPDTVRRDLRELADAGLLRRVHGGALPAAVGARPYAVRREQAPEAKEAIARATSGLFRQGQVILLDAGTTTLEVARRLPPDLEATVITNSPPIAVARCGTSGGMRYICPGTSVRVSSPMVSSIRPLRTIPPCSCG